MSQNIAELKILNKHAGGTPTLIGILLNRFEGGGIDVVSGGEDVGLYGPARPMVSGPTEIPLLEPQQMAEGEVLYYEDRVIFSPKAAHYGPIHGLLSTPDLGRPEFILPGNNQDVPLQINYTIGAGSWEDLLRLTRGTKQKQEENALRLLERLFENRLILQTVRRKDQVYDLSPRLVTLPSAGATRLFRLVFSLAENESLPDRELFTLGLQQPDSQLVPLASHSMYTRKDWDRFSFLHATDLHITRRAEYFREKLKAAGRASSARAMVNPNDSVRALFNFANQLHDRGDLDFILATGDLVDYIFESGDDQDGGGNFAYFEKLLLGQASSGDEEGVENQELHVPIFTVLGNHDYVINPYALYFQVDIWGIRNPIVERYPSFNLNKADALALQDGKLRSFSKESAKKMTLSSRTAPEYYFKHINSKQSYMIDLGKKHRIVMLDTGPNADVLDGTSDGIEEFFGFSNENERTFVRGTPNSSGEAFATLRELIQPPAGGVFVVGMHNPPLNTSGNEYPHYFRETERPRLDEERLKFLVETYLCRRAYYQMDPSLRRWGEPQHITWIRQRTRHFKTGSINDLLDFGIVNWQGADKMEFLNLCIEKKVDAVLYGHVHQRVEFRVKFSGNEGLLYFTDFYTENPGWYRESFDWFRKNVPAPGGDIPLVVGDQRPIHLQVDAEAEVGEEVRDVREKGMDAILTEYRTLRVPPYRNPLSQAKSKATWWEEHRPLILQTACIGPIDYSQRDLDTGEKTRTRAEIRFQGVRLLKVADNNISSITYIGIDDIQKGKLPASEQRSWLEPILHVMMC